MLNENGGSFLEVVALLTSLNAMGMPPGIIGMGVVLYFVLKKDLKGSFTKEIPLIIEPLLKPIVSAIQTHEKSYNEHLGQNNKRLERIEHKLEIKPEE